MTSTGTDTKNSHDSAVTAIANARTANGSSATETTATNRAARRHVAPNAGRSRSTGQAVCTSAATTRLRTSTSATASTTNAGQDGW